MHETFWVDDQHLILKGGEFSNFLVFSGAPQGSQLAWKGRQTGTVCLGSNSNDDNVRLAVCWPLKIKWLEDEMSFWHVVFWGMCEFSVWYI